MGIQSPITHISITLLREDFVQHRAVWTVPPAGEWLQQPGRMSRRSHGGERDRVTALRAQRRLWPRGELIFIIVALFSVCVQYDASQRQFYFLVFAEMVQKVTTGLDI